MLRPAGGDGGRTGPAGVGEGGGPGGAGPGAPVAWGGVRFGAWRARAHGGGGGRAGDRAGAALAEGTDPGTGGGRGCEEEIAERTSAPRRSGPEGEAASARAGGSQEKGREGSESLGGGGARLEERPGVRERTPGRPEMGVVGAGEGGGELEGS